MRAALLALTVLAQGCAEECHDLICGEDIWHIAVDDTQVYWQDGATLWRLSKSDRSRQRTAQTNGVGGAAVGGILVVNGRVIWNINSEIMAVSSDGTLSTFAVGILATACGEHVCYWNVSGHRFGLLDLATDSSNDLPFGPGELLGPALVGDSMFLYWLQIIPTGSQVSLRRGSLADGSVNELWQGSGSFREFLSAALDSESLYFTRAQSIARWALASTDPPTDYLNACPLELKADDRAGLLWIDRCERESGSRIEQFRAGVRKTLVEEKEQITTFTYDATDIYYAVKRCGDSACAPIAIRRSPLQ